MNNAKCLRHCEEGEARRGNPVVLPDTEGSKLGLGDPWTQGDRIRAMSDEELVEMLYNGVDAEYCRNAPECGEMLDADDGIPEEKCKGCLLNWLRQPVKEEST